MAYSYKDGAAGRVTIYNVALTAADTEYSQQLPADTRGIEFQSRGGNAIRFAFETGKVAGPTAPYATLDGAQNWYKSDLMLTATTTIYFASAVGSDTCELIVWRK